MLQWKPRLWTALAIVALITAALAGGDLELFGWWW
jgi:hypothetical protein